MPRPPPPSAGAAARSGAPAARAAGGRPAQPGAASRLTFGRGHRHGADARSGHVLTPAGIVTVTFANWLRRSVRHGIKSQFLCSIEAPFLRPDLGLARAPRAAAVKTGPTKGRATAEGVREAVLTAASTAPDLARLGAEVDHAACRSTSFLCSAKCCMSK